MLWLVFMDQTCSYTEMRPTPTNLRPSYHISLRGASPPEPGEAAGRCVLPRAKAPKQVRGDIKGRRRGRALF